MSVETSVYRYYDKHGRLIYVGITSRGVKRNREHNESKDWWTYVARQEVSHFGTREEASDLERELIRTYKPPFNVQHNPGWEAIQDQYTDAMNFPSADEQWAWSTAYDLGYQRGYAAAMADARLTVVR